MTPSEREFLEAIVAGEAGIATVARLGHTSELITLVADLSREAAADGLSGRDGIAHAARRRLAGQGAEA